MGIHYLSTTHHTLHSNNIHYTRFGRAHSTSTSSFSIDIYHIEPRSIYFSHSSIDIGDPRATVNAASLDNLTWPSF